MSMCAIFLRMRGDYDWAIRTLGDGRSPAGQENNPHRVIE
jgi:3'-phosphoadenosine 5'-phosphosulfate sulfotransferase